MCRAAIAPAKASSRIATTATITTAPSACGYCFAVSSAMRRFAGVSPAKMLLSIALRQMPSYMSGAGSSARVGRRS